MSINDIINYTAKAYTLDRSAAVQVLVAVLGVAISVSASLAALISAWATARSVREMRSARLQQARPALHPTKSARFDIKWRRSDNSYSIVDRESGEIRPFGFEMKNIGFGMAQEITAEISRDPVRADMNINISGIKRLFAAAELQVVKANNGIEVRDPYDSSSESKRLLTSVLHSVFSEKYVEADGVIHIGIGSFFVEAFIAIALSKFEEESFSWVWPIKIAYKSLANEKFVQNYNLVIFRNDVGFTLGAPVGQREGVPNWTNLACGISVYVSERVPEATVRAYLAGQVASKWRSATYPVWQKVIALRTVIRERVMYGRRSVPRFQIGDRVRFKPHADWKIVETIAPFESTPITPIDEDRYRAAPQDRV